MHFTLDACERKNEEIEREMGIKEEREEERIK